MADWEGLRHGLERSVAPPPLNALRERRRRRQQRRAIAMTSFVVLVGSAGGVAVLTRAEQQSDTTAALNQVVNGEKLPPPKDYEDHVVTDVDFVSKDVGLAIGLRCVGDACDVATWRTGDGGVTWSEPSTVATAVPRTTYHEESPVGGAVRSLRMVDERHGFAFNPALYVTDDGGTTWRRLPQQSKSTAVSVVGSTYWIAERGCPAGVDCDLVVRAGTTGNADDLRPLPLPETDGASAIVRRAGERNGYLVTWNAPRAAFHRTNDAGATWTEGVNPCPEATAQSLSAGLGRPLWLVCTAPDGRTAFQSDDHGTTWRPLAVPPGDGIVTDLTARTANDAFLTTQQPARLFVTSDGGATWQPAEGTDGGFGYGNLDVVDATHAWAMGDAGDLWRTTDGRRWERLALPPGAPLGTATPVAAPTTPPVSTAAVEWTGTWFANPEFGWAVGRTCAGKTCRAVLRRTIDGGDTWTEIPGPGAPYPAGDPTRGYTSVLFLDHQVGYVYGPELWFTTDGGVRWQRVEAGVVVQAVARDGDLWTVEYRVCPGYGLCFEAVRRGPLLSGERTTVLTNDNVAAADVAVSVADRDTAYVTGMKGEEEGNEVFLATTNGGQTWSRRTMPCAGGWTRLVEALDDGSLWAMCGYQPGAGNEAKRTSRSVDGGRRWIENGTGSAGYLHEFDAVSRTVGWRADDGPAAAIRVTRDGGLTWRAVPMPDSVGGGWRSFQMLDETHGFALAANGVFVRTTDGRRWVEMARP